MVKELFSKLLCYYLFIIIFFFNEFDFKSFINWCEKYYILFENNNIVKRKKYIFVLV